MVAPPASGIPGSTRPAELGEVLAGKYLIEEVIGEGGVGKVVAAHHLELDERVAIKFLRSEVMRDPDVVARFAHEAKAAVSIKCEYVARVFDVGMMTSGVPYLVMEYLEGHDLAQELLSRGPLPAKDAVEYAMQVCEALAVAHSKGVIHRDIKPENLFLLRRGDDLPVIKVLDFGISKAALTGSIFGGSLPKLDNSRVLGTPLYMSPEQIRATAEVDERADIWSLGMVLYELLTGAPGFIGDSISTVCASIVREPLPPLSMRRPDIHPGLVAVVERCLEKEPTHRFPNVAELSLALLPYAPKRARLNAERACNALRSLGSSARVLSTVPPPSRESMRDSQRLSSSNPSLRLAADLSGPVAALRAQDLGPPLAVQAVPSLAPAPKRGRWILLGAFGASVLAGAAIFAVKSASVRSWRTPALVTAAPSPPAPSALAPAAAAPTAISTLTSTATAPQAPVATTAAPVAPTPREWTAPRRAAPPTIAAKPAAAKDTAAPARAKVKQQDEPDLGY